MIKTPRFLQPKNIFSELCFSAGAMAILLQCCAPAFCGDRPAPDPLGYGERFWSDLKELPSKPGSWSTGQWELAGGVLAATGGALFFDDSVADHYDHHHAEDLRDLSNAVTHFGDYKYQLPVISGFWLSGYALGVPKLRQIGADAAEASIIAAFLINPVLCYMTGRALPSSGESPSTFRPFTWHRYSFPSGHAAAAFALASVLDTDLRDTFGYWQTPVLYGGALGVAQSRLYDKKHYLSDVILGGSIGWAIGTWVASKDRVPGAKASAGEQRLSLMPYNGGLMASYKF
jgi:membrane-associated phospholipid phosphatase